MRKISLDVLEELVEIHLFVSICVVDLGGWRWGNLHGLLEGHPGFLLLGRESLELLQPLTFELLKERY